MPLIAPLPTQTDGSLGRVKINARSISNLSTEVPAGEFNTHSKAIYDLCQTVGLSDGTTPGSVIEEVNDHEVRITALEAVSAVPARYYAGIVVGIATEGDTLDMCDYLDAGDGVQLQIALSVAAGSDKDVLVRPGTITLPSAPISIGSGTVVRFSGKTTIIPSSLDRRAVIISNDCVVENLIVVLLDPALGATGTAAVATNSNTVLKNTSVLFAYTDDFATMSNESLRYGIQASTGCTVIGVTMDLPNFENVGIANDFTGIYVQSPALRTTVTNVDVNGCDIGMNLQGSCTAYNVNATSITRAGIVASAMLATVGPIKIDSCAVELNPATEECSGIMLETGSTGLFGTTISNCTATCLTLGLISSQGIAATGTGVATCISSCVIDGFPIGIYGDITQTHVNAIGNIIRHPTTPQMSLLDPTSNASNNIFITPVIP